jgi:hypothetical protein
MDESLADLVLHDELPDAALEIAASKCWEQVANPFTLAFCTGLDTCPSYPVRFPSSGLRSVDYYRKCGGRSVATSPI